MEISEPKSRVLIVTPHTNTIGLYYHNTPIASLNLVTFDAGKKTIAAPDWSPIGHGRIYYYLQDSLEYIYQHYFITSKINRDDSKGLLYKSSDKPRFIQSNQFDLPVFKDKNELQQCLDDAKLKLQIPNEDRVSEPFTDESDQNELFYQVLISINNLK